MSAPDGQNGTVPRAIWTGSIGFGLVNVPVRMYSAIEEHTSTSTTCTSRTAAASPTRRSASTEDQACSGRGDRQGLRVEKGEYVYMADEDFEAARPKAARTIDIRDVRSVRRDRPDLLREDVLPRPRKDGERVYALLVEAMESSGLAGIAKFVMRDRQHLGCLRVREGAITLERMHFADEIRATDEIAPEGTKVEKQELELAASLIEQYTGTFEPEKFRDTYRDALCEIINAKQKGEVVHAPTPREGRGAGGPHGRAARERRGGGAAAWQHASPAAGATASSTSSPRMSSTSSPRRRTSRVAPTCRSRSSSQALKAA